MSAGSSRRVPGSERTLSDDPDRRAATARTGEADRRVRHADPAVRAELRRRRRRTNRVYALVGALLAVALLGYLAAYFLPVLAVRDVQVQTSGTVGAEEVERRAGVGHGTPLLQVDTHTVAKRVAGIPQVSEVTVTRDYPSTLRITVVERTALVAVDVDGTRHLVDDQGVDFGRGDAPPGTPVLTLADGMRSRLPQVARDLAAVFAEIRQAVGRQVTAVDVQSPASVVLTLDDGHQVEWGEPGRDHEKAVALHAVLDRPGHIWNVSNPAMPASR